MSHPLEDFLPFTAPWSRGASELAMVAAIRRAAMEFCERSHAWRLWLYNVSIAAYGASPRSVVTATIAAPSVFYWAAHGQAANQVIKLSTTGALPTGFDPASTFYLVPVDVDHFSLAAALNGAAIAGTGTQSGVHTAIAVAGEVLTTLAPPSDSRILSIHNVRYNQRNLDVDTPDSRRATGIDVESVSGCPVLYGSGLDSGGLVQLRLLPVVNVDIPSALRVQVWLAPTQAATTLPDWLYNKYPSGVGFGAAAMLHGSSEEWSKPEKVGYYRGLFEADIGAADHWAQTNASADARVTRGVFR